MRKRTNDLTEFPTRRQMNQWSVTGQMMGVIASEAKQSIM
jgi:hypothetical protein